MKTQTPCAGSIPQGSPLQCAPANRSLKCPPYLPPTSPRRLFCTGSFLRPSGRNGCSILLYGGSGRTGTIVMEQALTAGHSVRALVRDPFAISQTHANLTLIKGTPENGDDVVKAMQGCNAVISTLNNARASDSPFAKPMNRDNLLQDITDLTTATMHDQGQRRIVTLGAAGGGESYDTAPFLMQKLIAWSNLGHAYRDHAMVKSALAASGLDWTVGRAMMLGKKGRNGAGD
ncbi:NAD(P)H-binding protein [Sulfitobacter sp. HNIBRBA2951]|uniref:NAD(P)-dependent oxidoreductase n=1 Tax=Sulfitobacter aquimarinus TaxID=3158557 RepID=UPI0032DF88BE